MPYEEVTTIVIGTMSAVFDLFQHFPAQRYTQPNRLQNHQQASYLLKTRQKREENGFLPQSFNCI